MASANDLNAVIQGPYVQDILAQPDAVLNTLAGLGANAGIAQLGAALRSGASRRLVLTGMGASLYALVPLQLRLIQAGMAPLLIETGELLHHAPGLLAADAVVVAVSQSGRSAETVRLMEASPLAPNPPTSLPPT